MSRIVVTGMGIITPVGNSVSENHEALKAGKSGLSSIELFPTKFAQLLPFGEVKISNADLKEQLKVTQKVATRTTLLALYAVEQAIKDAATHFNVRESIIKDKMGRARKPAQEKAAQDTEKPLDIDASFVKNPKGFSRK